MIIIEMGDSRSLISIPTFFLVFLLVLRPNAAGGGGLAVCDTDPTSFLPPPYGNMSNLVCTQLWNTYTLRYYQSEDNVVTIILSAVYTVGWVGMGFSKDGMMAGASAMVGWISHHGQAEIKQYYLQGVTSEEVIPNKGELPLTNVPTAVVLHGATIYMAFQIKFEARLSRQPILLAFGTSYPLHGRLTTIHDDKTTVMFDFSAGSVSDDESPTQSTGRMKMNHGILGTVGWGLLLPCGAIIARYFKHKDPLWYYLHTIIQFSGFIFVIANVVLGSVLYDKIHANFIPHKGIGIFALTLAILQILAFFLRPNKDAKIRKYWNWYHHWFGRIALFFGALNIVLGIQIARAPTQWKITYGFLLAATLITVIVLETLAWMRKSHKPPAFQMEPIQ